MWYVRLGVCLGQCGVIVEKYRNWGDVPENLATKTQLGKMGLKPAKGQEPVAIKTGGYETYDLYDVSQAVPKRKITEAQAAALEQARIKAMTTTCCNRFVNDINWRYKYNMCEACYWEYRERQHQRFLDASRDDAIAWARQVVNDPHAVILDTETTGLDSGDVIVEVSVIDVADNVLIDTLVRPLKPILPAASNIHGITDDMCAAAPAWVDVVKGLMPILVNASRVVIYNASYDESMIYQTCSAAGLDQEWIEGIRFECAMEQYAAWYGDYSEYHGNFRWQRLNGGHRALGDCRATLELIRGMANSKTTKESES